MSRAKTVWLIVAASLVVLGLATVFVACLMGWNISNLGANKYQTNTYEVTQEFSNISIDTDTADITLKASDDGACRVICYEQERERYSVEVQNGTLTVNVINEKKWYDYIGINLDSPKITVYLPEAEYDVLTIEESTGDIEISRELKLRNIDISVSTGNVGCYASATEAIKISTSTGDIYAENISASSLALSVSTGDITASDIICEGDITIRVSTGKSYLTDISCKNLISSGDTGDISLTNTVATESFSIERSTGDVTLDSCDAAEIFIETDTGDVEGSLLSEKVFIVNTDTGKTEVPNSITGGRCEITTDTGDIKITVG